MNSDRHRDDKNLLTGERCERLRDAFEHALELAPSARGAWVGAHIPDDDDRAALTLLLAAESGTGPLDGSATSRVLELGPEPECPADGLIGQRIGAYRLVRLLGQGGMASVFLGEREGADFQQQVAVKLLRRGLYSALEQRLFRREQQALAALTHPNIAHLIDGGVSEAGIPFVILEFVDGKPITQFAIDGRLGLADRLRLFVSVCNAVAAAHRQLIVHRDLKPSNILVAANGQVKLLDFGIAKLLDDEDDGATRTGLSAFTRDYAAPEQYSGGTITTATDVYALGVLLHELLLGHRPLENAATVRRPSSRIDSLADDGHVLPTTPAALRTALKGDLDNIVLKALATEPEQRYAGAQELADDVERHLTARPVVAHPPSRWYRTRKFVQRHRGGVVVSVALVLALIASSGITAWQASVARREAQRANLVRDFVVGLFESAQARLPRDQRPTPEILVEQARSRLESMPGIDDATLADMLGTLGGVWLTLSKFGEADASFSRALALVETRGDPAASARLRVLRADGWRRAGRDSEAAADLDRVLPVLRADPSPLLLRALGVMALARHALGEHETALAVQREAVSLAERLYGPDSIEALATALEMGNLLATMERFPESTAMIEPLLARWRAAHAPEDDRYVQGLENLAIAGYSLGEDQHAEARFNELLELKKRIYPAPHDAIASTMRDLARVLMRMERHEEAQALFEEALAIQQQVLGADHSERVSTLDSLGVSMVMQRRFSEGDARYLEALAICERLHLRDERCSRTRNNLGQSYYRQNRLDDAEREMRVALAERRQLFGNDHPNVAISLSTLANVTTKKGEHDEAVRLFEEALALFQRIGHDESIEAALIYNGYAQALNLSGQREDALAQIDRALSLWRRLVPDGHRRELMMLVLKALIQRDSGRIDDARQTVDAALALDVPAEQISPVDQRLLRELGSPAVPPARH